MEEKTKTRARLPRRTEAMITLVLQDGNYNTISLATKTTEVWYDQGADDKVYSDIEALWKRVQKDYPKYQSVDEEYNLVGALGITNQNSRKPYIVWVTQAKHPKTEARLLIEESNYAKAD